MRCWSLEVDLQLNSGLTRGWRGNGEWRRRGVYTSGTAVCAAVCAAVSAAQWASTSAKSAPQCRCEPALHALFFQAAQTRWPIRAAILFTLVRFPLPVFRSRANLVERQFRICVVIGCRLPDAGEIAHAGSALWRWITGSWRPLDAHFERFLSGNRAVVARVNSA